MTLASELSKRRGHRVKDAGQKEAKMGGWCVELVGIYNKILTWRQNNLTAIKHQKVIAPSLHPHRIPLHQPRADGMDMCPGSLEQTVFLFSAGAVRKF